MRETTIFSELIELIDDPTKISIWQEIFENKGITAKEINRRLTLKGTRIYFHLNYLEKHELILSKTRVVPNSNLLEKTYEVNNKIFSQDEREKKHESINYSEKIREILLLKTYMIISYFQQQARKLSSMTNDNLKQLVDQGAVFINDILYVDNKDLENIIKKFKELKRELNDLRGDQCSEDYLDDSTNRIILSILPLKEI